MLLRLPKNAYVRQYGTFTCVIERIKNFDQVYLDAKVFFRWLTREPMEIAEILGNICKVYEGADQRPYCRTNHTKSGAFTSAIHPFSRELDAI